ncbi:hypothetical protein HK099_000435 [Clydaea vesicula]|uniref:Uncharacterized protein n=1 Tax=Clydaea vesicula TaxID=447962 RepID=A0AAD5U7R6_9FUNG|nr:hypothetical protein HK099_000435 [Clydaea vesicula]
MGKSSKAYRKKTKSEKDLIKIEKQPSNDLKQLVKEKTVELNKKREKIFKLKKKNKLKKLEEKKNKTLEENLDEDQEEMEN